MRHFDFPAFQDEECATDLPFREQGFAGFIVAHHQRLKKIPIFPPVDAVKDGDALEEFLLALEFGIDVKLLEPIPHSRSIASGEDQKQARERGRECPDQSEEQMRSDPFTLVAAGGNSRRWFVVAWYVITW